MGLGVFGEFAFTILVAVVASAVTYLVALRVFEGPQRFLFESLKKTNRIRALVPRLADSLFFTFLLTYVVVFSWLMVLKHQSFHTGYDFAISDQVVWNSLHGRLLETSITGLGSTWLGTHFAPILLSLVPLYALWNDPQILLIFQTFALAFMAFPLYWLARKWLGNLLAVTITLAFFLFPAQQYVNLSEFHEIALATPLLALATYFLMQRRFVPLLASLVLALLIREEVAFIVIAFGFIVFLHGKPQLGLGLFVFGLFWAVALLQHVIPFFAGREHAFVIGLHYSSFGNNPSEILHSILSKPDLVLRTILMPAKAEFVLHLFVPLAFLPLAGPELTMLALPTFGYLLLAGEAQSSIRFQYTAPLLPFLSFGTVLGLQRILKWSLLPQVFRFGIQSSEIRLFAVKAALAALLLVASLASYYLYAPGPLARNFNPSVYTGEASRAALGHALMDRIPADAALLTYGGLTPQLSHRTRIYYLPFIDDFRLAEYIFVDTAQCAWCKRGLDPMLVSGYFETVVEKEGYFLARRRPLEYSLQTQFEDQISLLGYTIVTTNTLRGGQVLRPIVGWRADQTISKRYVIRVNLVDNQKHIWVKHEAEPQDGVSPTNLWVPGRIVGDQYSLVLPSTMPPGECRITVGVYDPESERFLVARDSAGEPMGEEPVIVSLRIEKDKSSITASQLQAQFQLEQPYFVDMGEIRLIGYKSLPRTIAPGQVLPVGLFWRARGKPRGDYGVSVQLRDSSGRTVFEQKNRPAGGTYPTIKWDEGEVLLDWHDLVIPSSITFGEYTVQIVLSDIASGATLGETALASLSVINSNDAKIK